MHLKHSSRTQLEPEIGETSQTISTSSVDYLLQILTPFSLYWPIVIIKHFPLQFALGISQLDHLNK